MRVLITGANRGIGLELARVSAARGDEVHACARDPNAAALRDLAAAHPKGRVVSHFLDVTDDVSCLALGRAVGDAEIDLLINNAGVGGTYAPGVEEIDLREAMQVYDSNALGPLRVTRAVLPGVRRARGKIVHITSLMGSMGDNRSGRAYAYRMSKAALNMASTNLALELRPSGVLSVVVNPGWVRTDMGGKNAPTSVETAAAQIIALCDRLTLADSGKFLGADGTDLPW